MSDSLIFPHFFFFCERCEWIAHFAQIKWTMWSNRSFCSPKMSNHERFAQVAQRKWAVWANRSFRSLKMSKWVNLSVLSESLICSFFYKRFAQKSNERIPGLGTAFFSVPNDPFFCILFKECSILFCSFFKFLATYETQKNVPFFSIHS